MLNYADCELSKEGPISKHLSKKAIKSFDSLILAQNAEAETSVLSFTFTYMIF